MNKQEISLKKIYDKVSEDIFEMSNVRNCKEIGKMCTEEWPSPTLCTTCYGEIKNDKKNIGDVYTLLCLR